MRTIAMTERPVALRVPRLAVNFLWRNPAKGSVRNAKSAPVRSPGNSGSSTLAVNKKKNMKKTRGLKAVIGGTELGVCIMM